MSGNAFEVMLRSLGAGALGKLSIAPGGDPQQPDECPPHHDHVANPAASFAGSRRSKTSSDGSTPSLSRCKDSPLWTLKEMVDEAAAAGKDLIEDMVRRLTRDIMAARNRLDAMLWNP